MDGIELSTRKTDECVVVKVTGELDLASRADLCACMDRAIDTCDGAIVIDLSGVSFIDAQGLSALVHIRRHAEALRTDLRLANAPPGVLRLLDITMLEETFTLAPSANHAIRLHTPELSVERNSPGKNSPGKR